jgi:hypothetical protein
VTLRRGRACARANASRIDPLAPVPRVQALLGGDLGRGAAVQRAAGARIQALGALAHHDQVDLAGLTVASGLAVPGTAATGAG